jgi:hypothetical protein
MSLPKFNPRTAIILLITVVVAALRIFIIVGEEYTALANFSSIGAMALFGGAYFNKPWKAFSLPLLALFISDLILSFTVFNQYRHGILYGGWYWIYGAFALMTVAGRLLLKKVGVANVIAGTLACVFIHWIVTDLGVWYGSSRYPQTVAGFWACLVKAIPFEWRFLAGTALYSGIMFGLFEWLQYRNPVLSSKRFEPVNGLLEPVQ